MRCDPSIVGGAGTPTVSSRAKSYRFVESASWLISAFGDKVIAMYEPDCLPGKSPWGSKRRKTGGQAGSKNRTQINDKAASNSGQSVRRRIEQGASGPARLRVCGSLDANFKLQRVGRKRSARTTDFVSRFEMATNIVVSGGPFPAP